MKERIDLLKRRFPDSSNLHKSESSKKGDIYNLTPYRTLVSPSQHIFFLMYDEISMGVPTRVVVTTTWQLLQWRIPPCRSIVKGSWSTSDWVLVYKTYQMIWGCKGSLFLKENKVCFYTPASDGVFRSSCSPLEQIIHYISNNTFNTKAIFLFSKYYMLSRLSPFSLIPVQGF